MHGQYGHRSSDTLTIRMERKSRLSLSVWTKGARLFIGGVHSGGKGKKRAHCGGHSLLLTLPSVS